MTLLNTLRRAFAVGTFALLAACGGGGSGDAPPPPETGTPAPPVVPPAPVAPTITLQPVAVTAVVGATATFTVAATGTAPLAYQWQRGGVAIAGATGTSYTTPAVTLADTGAGFRAVVTNVAGSATSNTATLTVNPAPSAPTLTISPQPANVTVTAGATASFTVGGTCSSGILTIQWQRSNGQTFADIAGATATTYSFMTATGDNGALFRANLSCSGQSTTASSAATLTVGTPGAITLSSANVIGLRALAPYAQAISIDQQADGSYVFYGAFSLWRLSADLSSISLFAGSTSLSGLDDGTGAAAKFMQVNAITHDASGNLWIADGSRVRRVTPAGVVTTIAGGTSGSADGTGTAAQFNSLNGIAFGADGDLYLTDPFNGRIRRMTTAGVVTTYLTGLNAPNGIAVNSANDVFVADGGANRVYRIVRNGTVAGALQTLAGNGSFVTTSPADGPGATAEIAGPGALLLRGTTLFTRDFAGLIRSIDTTTGVVTTFAGAPALGAGYADGAIGQGQFSTTRLGLTNGTGNGFVVADGAQLRAVDAAGTVKTFAEGAISNTVSVGGDSSSTGVLAQQPFDYLGLNLTTVAVDSQGRIVIGEANERQIRRIDTAGNVTLLAGLIGSAGSIDGVGSVAQLNGPGALTIASSGLIYFGTAYSLKRLDPVTNAVTTIAGSNTNLGSGAVNGPPGTGLFGSVNGIVVTAGGDAIVSDGNNTAMRRVDAAGNLTTFSGLIGARGTADGPAMTARYDAPGQLLAAPDGTMVLNDNGKLRRILTDGNVTTFPGVTGVMSMVIDPTGVIYVLRNDGLSSVSSTGALTLLVPAGGGLVLGNVAPTLGTVNGSMAMLSAKQIVVVASRTLAVITLP